ncbi:glycosyltransferase [Candidatus Pelagibacter sp.]|nr:glycosyltransferase [Candidatus Pelagibacter sp.]
MKIIHIINSLKKGGAEGNLFRLCKTLKKKYKNKIDITIITLIDNGFYEEYLGKLGIKVYSIKINEKKNFFKFVTYILKLRKFITNNNPDVIQSWMYHSNFITLFLPKIFYEKIFWNIRHTQLNLKISKKFTIFLSLICGFFSKLIPKKIIYCSEASISFHENFHKYSKNKSVLIDNGYSFKNYYYSLFLRNKFRKKYKINKKHFLIGFAGRYSKQKNIPSLIKAFSNIIKKYDDVYLYMVGKNINYSNKELAELVLNLKITDRVFFLKEKKNLLKFYNGLDMLILPSHDESFPNVVAEAMLCKIPVLSSDVGCAKKIINSCGFIMRKNDPNSIYKNIIKCLNIYRNKKKFWTSLKKNSRLRIVNNYSLNKMAINYLKKWTLG